MDKKTEDKLRRAAEIQIAYDQGRGLAVIILIALVVGIHFGWIPMP